jgi:hypothetical protein
MRELGAPQGSLLVASLTYYQTTKSVQKKKIKMGINLFPSSNGQVLDGQNRLIPLPPFQSFDIPLRKKRIKLDNVFS